jgi:hypothetical protein
MRHRWNRILAKYQLWTRMLGKRPHRKQGQQIEAWHARTQHNLWREQTQSPLECWEGTADPSLTNHDDTNGRIDKSPQRPLTAQYNDRDAHASRGERIAKKYRIAFGTAAFESERDHREMRSIGFLFQRHNREMSAE